MDNKQVIKVRRADGSVVEVNVVRRVKKSERKVISRPTPIFDEVKPEEEAE